MYYSALAYLNWWHTNLDKNRNRANLSKQSQHINTIIVGYRRQDWQNSKKQAPKVLTSFLLQNALTQKHR